MRVHSVFGCMLITIVVVSGCGKAPPPTFVLSKKTHDLVDDARLPVVKALDENFGTPIQLVGWQKFPIDYGDYEGPTGKVVASSGEGAPSAGEFAVSWTEAAASVPADKEVYWKSGSNKGTKSVVGKYNAVQSTLTLKADLPQAPAIDDEFVIVDKAPGWKLVDGRNLYMQHCLHCHGVSGDGDGPTAKFLNPRPRDYRQGKFKFTSTLSGIKPSKHDLHTTLVQGIPGTSMPSFVLLGDKQLGLLVEYVRWLSCRGELESKLVNEMAAMGGTQSEVDRQAADAKKEGSGKTKQSILEDLKKSIKEDFEDGGKVEESATDLADAWVKADLPESVVVPKIKRTPPTKESMKRGRELYTSKKAKCIDCHGSLGRGDGTLTEDFWPIPGSSPEQRYARPGLHDDWGNPQQPRNLTRGVYRGGRRPLDLYRRVYSGIKGTQMPAFGGTALTDAEIWDLVNYVMSLPFDGKVSAQPAETDHSAAGKVAASGH